MCFKNTSSKYYTDLIVKVNLLIIGGTNTIVVSQRYFSVLVAVRHRITSASCAFSFVNLD